MQNSFRLKPERPAKDPSLKNDIDEVRSVYRGGLNQSVEIAVHLVEFAVTTPGGLPPKSGVVPLFVVMIRTVSPGVGVKPLI